MHAENAVLEVVYNVIVNTRAHTAQTPGVLGFSFRELAESHKKLLSAEADP
jgi:hypothetical protein